MPTRWTKDYGNFTARLMQAKGRIVRSVNDQIEIEARKIAAIAKKMAPREYGAIEAAIKVDSARQRRTWIVYVDESVRRMGMPPKAGGTVGDYLAYAHDLNQGLGPESMAKQATTQYRVGLKFMERALEAGIREGALRRIQAAGRRSGVF